MKKTILLLLIFMLGQSPDLLAQRRPSTLVERTYIPKDSTLHSAFNNKIILSRYLPTKGEWGGTNDTIVIYRDTIACDTGHYTCIKLDYHGVERLFGPDTILILKDQRIQSISPDSSIYGILNAALDQIVEGIKASQENGGLLIWGHSGTRCSIQMQHPNPLIPNPEEYSISSVMVKEEWPAFQELLSIIENETKKRP